MSLTPLPPASFREKYIFFALPSMNVPLPAELKFGENPVDDYRNSPTIKFCADLSPTHRCPSAIKFKIG